MNENSTAPKWYIADLVVEIQVEDDHRNVVHTNTMLVLAASREEAYDKAVELGNAEETSFTNPEGKLVTFKFRGLHHLDEIHDELRHGAELTYSERIGMDEGSVAAWVRQKEDLSIFRPPQQSPGPDYSAGYIMEELYEKFPHLKPTPSKEN